jgi:NADH-ubiquinone oxidoreductase chain 5
MCLPRVILFYSPPICNLISFLLAISRCTFLSGGLYTLFLGSSRLFELNIIRLNSLEFNYIIILDGVSLTFMSVVTLIASCVVFYRNDYIQGDPNINRFIIIVLIFVVSIIALILSPNIIRILLGWDGLGLVSYALVIYYQNIKSYNAGILTALSNRIGDVIILISISYIRSVGSFNFINFMPGDTPNLVIIRLLVTIAACTKRAQIPFSAWLPAAMAAPTPVSALVHSSTLVTAGVYLLIRFRNPIIESGLNKPLIWVAILTMLIAGIGANIEIDLKKIIALSTLRQLGLMIIRIGLGLIKIAYFHILTHALFKALLFICAGNIIHCSGDTQDLRKIGAICSQMPFTRACINTANLALCGTPFLAGFYSKDLILEIIIMQETNHLALILAFTATALTVTYSARLRCYSILRTPNNISSHSLSDTSNYSNTAIIPLTILTILGGVIIS